MDGLFAAGFASGMVLTAIVAFLIVMEVIKQNRIATEKYVKWVLKKSKESNNE